MTAGCNSILRGFTGVLNTAVSARNATRTDADPARTTISPTKASRRRKAAPAASRHDPTTLVQIPRGVRRGGGRDAPTTHRLIREIADETHEPTDHRAHRGAAQGTGSHADERAD